MSREVECKTRIPDSSVDGLKRKLSLHFAEEAVSVRKEDVYFAADGTELLFRVRSDGRDVFITRKARQTRGDGVEVNEEIEFSSHASELASVERFFLSLGYGRAIEKRKNGWAWYRGDLTAELVRVTGLGWFLELEFLLPDEAPDELVGQAAGKLEELRTALGVRELPLESRYYVEMLKDLEH